MRQIGRKLKSEQGVSIVLALLLMLACLMVGASVLMAASSNGGRVRSNRQEQQAYFALSSALRMVADDLAGAEYKGQFNYTKTETIDEGSGEVLRTDIKYTQTEGQYDCLLGKMFVDNLDALFADYLKEYVLEKRGTAGAGTVYEYEVLTVSNTSPIILTVTPDQEQLRDFEVKIEAELQDTYNMELTGRLVGFPEEYGADAVNRYEDYVLEAELTPIESSSRVDEESMVAGAPSGTYSSTPMRWELKWIIRPEEEGE